MIDPTTISLCIAALSVVFAFAAYSRNAGQDKQKEGALKTTLDFVAQDVKEIKIQQQSIAKRLDDIESTANDALHRAKAANDRLDAIKAPSASAARYIIAHDDKQEEDD